MHINIYPPDTRQTTMRTFNEWMKTREAYENSPSEFIGRDKNKPPRVKPHRLSPEDRKELYKRKRSTDNLLWKPIKKNIEDLDA